MCFAGIEDDVRALEARRQLAARQPEPAEPRTFRLPRPDEDKTVKIERPSLREPQAA